MAQSGDCKTPQILRGEYEHERLAEACDEPDYFAIGSVHFDKNADRSHPDTKRAPAARSPSTSEEPEHAGESKCMQPESPEVKIGPGSRPAPGPYTPLRKASLAPLRELARAINHAAEEDRFFRSSGRGRLYELSDLVPFERLGHGLPSLRATKMKDLGSTRAANNLELGRRLKEAFPALHGFPLQVWGFVLAGGIVSACLMWEDSKARGAFGDADLFLVGRTDATARESIRALARHLADQWRTMRVSRTVNCITFSHGQSVIQVVLRLFVEPLEVISDFDLGSCAVLWDGRAALFTAYGRLAAEHGANVLNLASRRRTYERRLLRYYSRGYDIVLPELDVSSLASDQKPLPFLDISLGDRPSCPCHIEPVAIMARASCGQIPSSIWDEYAADRSIDYTASNRVTLDRNLKALMRGSRHGLVARAEYSRDLDLFAIAPKVDAEAILDRVWPVKGEYMVDVLKRVLGQDLAIEFLSAVVTHSDDLKRAKEAAAQICRKRAETLQDLAHIRFAFLSGPSAGGCADPGAQPVTAAQWYGREPLPAPTARAK